MASAEIRNTQAGPSENRTLSISRGMAWGRATCRATSQVEAPSVWALTICSSGMAATCEARSRTMKGVMPTKISTILAVSPRPKTMNNMGRTAMGGITDMVATRGPRPALA